MNALATTYGGWTRSERLRLGGIIGAIVALHIVGWTLYLWQSGGVGAATGFAGAGTLAYVLGMRHAFDADHIAAIDDTTRLMLLRGKRPAGVGFFFALGHSSVVLMLAVITAVASSQLTGAGLEEIRSVGGVVSVFVAIAFLLLVAVLNIAVLRGLIGLWRQYRARTLNKDDIDVLLLNRGLMNRIFGARARMLTRSSWHMAPVGFLFGLGLETASEVTLLTLSASTASEGHLPFLAVLSLPLLFAAGMSMLDTADSLLMTRAYSWAHRSPGRRLYYNVATTGVTVVIGLFVASVYLAGVVAEHLHVGWLDEYASLADQFEFLGYIIVAVFGVAWLAAVLLWKFRYGRHDEEGSHGIDR
ncbi:HoxN/HupN/NixA family nickel/cobalt transporter [Saccharopolyspora phatthalungensis]|uniref:Nickel/cobalt efflux system n=1 Tax=Saccharopolyspora phatthalungensis TaxID=664693 RepID=A0A840QBX7_9PSEU|nr:HoxN/HupN/NixA family nickel/cobalt transporter [Saccharopolyspora phatthalungensis]MBB5157280.1 high-affinity nickel-transport protein [Saccharopolyspora phatthalungensis]